MTEQVIYFMELLLVRMENESFPFQFKEDVIAALDIPLKNLTACNDIYAPLSETFLR